MEYQYQEQAFQKLAPLKCGALFMDIGTGKTKTTVQIASKHKSYIDCIIWLAPASLINDSAYRAEIEKWNNCHIKIHYFTIEGVSQSDTAYLKLIKLAKETRNFCVIDESLSIKNLMSKRTKRLLEQWEIFDFRFILNGTPVTRNLVDLYPQIQFLHPRILGMTEAQFANNFLEYQKDGFRPYARWSRPHNEQALIEIIRPYIFDKELDLERKLINHNIELKLSKEEYASYKELKDNMIFEQSFLDFLAVAQKFQHHYTFAESKIEKLNSLIEKDKKYIIFVKFIHEVEKLKGLYPDALIYTGDKKDDLSSFKDKNHNILIMTYGTGSQGHNLQFCNNIIFFTPTFDYKQFIHAVGRCYRKKQEHDVNIYQFFLDTGLDLLIKSSLGRKEKLLKNIKDFIEKRDLSCL